MKKSIEDAINAQIQHEFYAAYLYLSMCAYFESTSLVGFAARMKQQAQEEIAHGMKLFDFVNDRNGRVRLQVIDEPQHDFGGPLEAMERALEHERKVTGMIHGLYELAGRESDYATQVELQWFITEQVEEEDTAQRVVDRLRLAGNDGAALLLLDRDMGAAAG